MLNKKFAALLVGFGCSLSIAYAMTPCQNVCLADRTDCMENAPNQAARMACAVYYTACRNACSN